MQLAIHLYEEGKDTDAMDRFMEVLVHGELSERPMANEYLNLITQHQQLSGAGFLKPRLPSSVQGAVAAPVNEPLHVPAPAPAGKSSRPIQPAIEAQPVPLGPRASSPEEVKEFPGTSGRRRPARGGSSAAMRQDVSVIVASKARGFLSDLRQMDQVRIILSDELHPRAIGIPSGLLFDRGIVFRKSSSEVLRALTGLVYSLGATQVAILPEGAVSGDSRILDMRRTMGISAYLYSQGVAPPRIRINLLASQVDFPRGLSDFRGVILLFVYDQPLRLVSDGGVGEEPGPPISLGVFPRGLRTDRSEGVIVEFSVSEPPAGLSSWKFQLLKPSARAGGGADLVQEIVGEASVFHQIYWNGRKDYFGKPLPSGRYEAFLTAKDSLGKSRSAHEWIAVEGAEGSSAAAASGAGTSKPRPQASEPAAVRKVTRPEPRRVLAAVPGKKAAHPVVAPKLAASEAEESKHSDLEEGSNEESIAPAGAESPAPPTETPSKSEASGAAAPHGDAPPPADSDVECSGAVTWRVAFTRGHQAVTQEGGRSLAQVADAIGIYPLDKVNLTGYANSDEPDSETLAKGRAESVSKALTDQYQVASGRIRVHSKVTDQDRHEVEICILSGKD